MPERILYRDVITYPPLREDLAFVVDEAVPAGDADRGRARGGGDEVREVRFLSDYRGEPIPAGKKSVAIAVAFQSARADALGRGRRAPAQGRGRRARARLRRHAARLTAVSGSDPPTWLSGHAGPNRRVSPPWLLATLRDRRGQTHRHGWLRQVR